MPPFYAGGRAPRGRPSSRPGRGRDLRLGPTLEYALETCPSLGCSARPPWWSACRPNTTSPPSYRTNQCFLDADGRFQPSVYVADGSADLFCVESLMLREGLTVEPFGTRPGERARAGSATATSCAWAGSSSSPPSLPHEIGFVLGGRVDYNVTYAPQFSPRVALVAPFRAGFYSKAQFSSGFVYPAFLYRTGNSLSDYQGNPDIQPAVDPHGRGAARLEERDAADRAERLLQRRLAGSSPSICRATPAPGNTSSPTRATCRWSGWRRRRCSGCWADGCLVDLQGTYARPLSGTSADFLVDDQLGGPSKYPSCSAGWCCRPSPVTGLRLTWTPASARASSRPSPPRCVRGDHRHRRASLGPWRPSDFDTREMTWALTVTFAFGNAGGWKASATNLLNRRAYRPGSVLVPYLAEGRRLNAGLSVSF